MWIGPYQIVAADEFSFRVRHLVTGAEQHVHASRLKVFAANNFKVTQGIVLQVAKLVRHRWNP
ncbi:TPA: hypothetical protein N0F65_009487 [Lagenidium giganteum]|uniref:Transposase n=1 Tax=Lagenidium giganteum TaxID=4803 RepID=A0AAV2ZBW8_9STRA|nr:TPA: hypothetical protein N0F65_009487 [Lagenidium giganteum]